MKRPPDSRISSRSPAHFGQISLEYPPAPPACVGGEGEWSFADRERGRRDSLSPSARVRYVAGTPGAADVHDKRTAMPGGCSSHSEEDRQDSAQVERGRGFISRPEHDEDPPTNYMHQYMGGEKNTAGGDRRSDRIKSVIPARADREAQLEEDSSPTSRDGRKSDSQELPGPSGITRPESRTTRV